MVISHKNIAKAIILLFSVSIFLFESSNNGTLWDIATASLLVYTVFLAFSTKKARKSAYQVWVIVMLVCMFFSVFYSVSSDGAITTSMNQLRIVLYSISFMYVIQSTDNMKWAVFSIYLAALALSIQLLMNADWTYILATSTKYANTLRVGLNQNQHVNITAYNLVVGCMCGFLYFRIWGSEWNKKGKLLFVISEIIVMMAIFATGARKSILALGVIIISQFWDKKRALKIIIGVISLYVIWIALLNVPVLYQVLGNRIEPIFSGEMDTSSAERINLMREAFVSFINHPVFGVGIDQLKHYTSEFRYAHNNFLEILADLGLIGFVVYYSLIAKCAYRAFTMKIEDYRLKTSLCAVICSFLIMDFFQVSYQIMTNIIFTMILSEVVLREKEIIQ